MKRDHCWLECLAEASSRTEICENEKNTQVFNPKLTIILYAIIRLSNMFALGKVCGNPELSFIMLSESGIPIQQTEKSPQNSDKWWSIWKDEGPY